MENNIKVSVLIATYNGAKTIKRAIDSVLNQTFKDFELIVLDDGSTDNTQETINLIKDERIKFIRQENKGIASSRNRLLSEALGDYVIYLDSDDWMENNTLEKLVNKVKEGNYDAVVCNYRYIYEDGSSKDIIYKSFDNKNMRDYPELLVKVMPQPWNKLVKKQAMDNSNISFPDGLVFEDLCYYSCLMPHLNKVAMIEDCLINYVQLSSSIMSEAKTIKNTIYDFDKVIGMIDDYYNNNYQGLYVEEKEGLFVLNAREIIDAIFANKNVMISEKEKAIHSLLNTINNKYPNWYQNKYYKEKLKNNSIIYKMKRKTIDKLLVNGKYRFVLEDIIK